MNQAAGEPFLIEEIEFDDGDESFIYSFRCRDSRITLKRVPSPGVPHEPEVDVFPNASMTAVNTAVLVLYKAAITDNGISVQDFLPATLRKLLTHYSSPERLEVNMREGTDAFAGRKLNNTPVEDIIKFLEPYTPWTTNSSPAISPSRRLENTPPVPSPQKPIRQSIQDVLDLPTKSDQLSGLRETFGLPSSTIAKSPLNAVRSTQSPERMISVSIPKISLLGLAETSETCTPAERFEEPSVPVTPQSQPRVNSKQPNGPTLPSHEDTTPSTSPAKDPSLLPPTPAPTPSPAVPRADPPTTLNLKRQRCQDPFAFNSSEEDDGVVLVNVPRKRRHIDQDEGAGEDDHSQTGSISTVATPPSQPPDTRLPSPTSQSAAPEVIKDVKDEVKQITSTREIIDLDEVEQEDMAMEQEDQEADRTFETQRARYNESKAARQALRLKRYREITNTLRSRVKILEEEVGEKQTRENELNTVNADLRRIQHENSEQKKELENKLNTVNADLQRIQHEKTEKENELGTVTADVAAMAKKNEETCKEKEKLKSEKEALLARMKQLEAKNSLVVDELSKANEKVQELTQMKDNLLTQRGTLNADKNKLKEKLKWRNETQYILSEALEKAKENIARLEKSLAQEVKDNERVKKELEVSRNDAQEANNKAAANNEREVEAIKKRKEYEAILADLRDHESKTTVSRLTILRRIPK